MSKEQGTLASSSYEGHLPPHLRQAFCAGHRRDERLDRFDTKHITALGTYAWCCLEWWAMQGDDHAKAELAARG
jgi:hypothetical protein